MVVFYALLNEAGVNLQIIYAVNNANFTIIRRAYNILNARTSSTSFSGNKRTPDHKKTETRICWYFSNFQFNQGSGRGASFVRKTQKHDFIAKNVKNFLS